MNNIIENNETNNIDIVIPEKESENITIIIDEKPENENDLVKKEYIVQTTGKGVIIRGMLRIDSIIDTKPNSLHI